MIDILNRAGWVAFVDQELDDCLAMLRKLGLRDALINAVAGRGFRVKINDNFIIWPTTELELGVIQQHFHCEVFRLGNLRVLHVKLGHTLLADVFFEEYASSVGLETLFWLVTVFDVFNSCPINVDR